MNEWRTESLRVLRAWAGNTSSDVEFVLAILLGIVLAAAIHEKVMRLARTGTARGPHSAVTVFAGIALVLASTVAFNLKVLPFLGDIALRPWAPVVCPLLACLALAVPLSALLHRRNYFEALFAVALSVAAAVTLGLLLHGVMEAGRLGFDEFRQTKGRTDSINREL